MCVQGRFCLQRKPRQANPQPFPYPLTGGLGLIKLLSKTRRDEFPSSHLPCHPFNSAEIHSFLFSYAKMERGELALRGTGREGRGKERRSRRCSIPGTKEPKQSEWEVTGKGQAPEQLLGFSGWDLLFFFLLSVLILNTKKNVTLRKDNAFFLACTSQYLSPANEGLEN